MVVVVAGNIRDFALAVPGNIRDFALVVPGNIRAQLDSDLVQTGNNRVA